MIGTVWIVIPAIARANNRYKNRSFKLTDEYKHFREVAGYAAMQAGVPRITEGRWHADIKTYWGKTRHLDDVDVPNGDIDATVKATLDALQHAGVIDDDIRVVSATLHKYVDKHHPRVRVCLTRVPMGEAVS